MVINGSPLRLFLQFYGGFGQILPPVFKVSNTADDVATHFE